MARRPCVNTPSGWVPPFVVEEVEAAVLVGRLSTVAVPPPERSNPTTATMAVSTAARPVRIPGNVVQNCKKRFR